MKKLILFACVLLVCLIASYFLPLAQWVNHFLAWIETHQQWAILIFILVYVIACVLMVPASLLTLVAGFIFGVVSGSIIISVASTVGASLAFLIAKFIARDTVKEKLAGNEKFSQLDHAIGQKGWVIVFLTRLSPVFPFNLLNYAYGLTSIKTWHYIIASWVGMMPGTVLYVYIGSVAQDLTALLNGELPSFGAGQALFWTGLIATLVVTVVITRIATRALKANLAPSTNESAIDEKGA